MELKPMYLPRLPQTGGLPFQGNLAFLTQFNLSRGFRARFLLHKPRTGRQLQLHTQSRLQGNLLPSLNRHVDTRMVWLSSWG